jgi:hypothetical protein
LPGYPGLKFGLPAGRRLMRQWRQQRPDLVHVVTEGPLGWSAVSVARKWVSRSPRDFIPILIATAFTMDWAGCVRPWLPTSGPCIDAHWRPWCRRRPWRLTWRAKA